MASVFISYGHASEDRRVAAWLADLLRASGHDVWRDDSLRAQSGVELNKEIAEAIASRSHILFLQSSMSLSSGYCQAEVAYAMELAKPLVRIEIEPTEGRALPPQLLPLLGQAKAAAALHGAEPGTWSFLVADAVACAGLGLGGADIDPVRFSPYAHIVRPSYAALRSGDAASWASAQQRLIDARAIAPTNGYTALSLSLLRTFMGEADAARADAEIALQHLPRTPDAYYAAALAMCAGLRAEKRSKPEADAILSRLATGRAQSGAGVHLWLLAALVTEHFYTRRYLPAPAPPQILLEEGLSRGEPNADECQRVWDIEGAGVKGQLWENAARAMGFTPA